MSNEQLVISTTQGASVVDTQTGKAIRQWKFGFPPLIVQGKSEPNPRQSHISADGQTVIALGNGRLNTTVFLYNARTGKARGRWTYPGPSVFRNPRLSPDGTLWKMKEEQGSARSNGVYDARTGQRLWGPFAANNAGKAWQWSADSKRIVAVVGASLPILDARTGREIGLKPGSDGNQSLALDAQGNYFYTLDDTGKIWR